MTLEDIYNSKMNVQRNVASGEWSTWKPRFSLKAIISVYKDPYLRNIFNVSDIDLNIHYKDISNYREEIIEKLVVNPQELDDIIKEIEKL